MGVPLEPALSENNASDEQAATNDVGGASSTCKNDLDLNF
jgi:hypothetical protein